MAKVTTGAGDRGYTGLLGDERVPKHHPRIEALGALDEASAVLGLARAQAGPGPINRLIEECQRDLYRLMGEVAATGDNARRLGLETAPAATERLEAAQADLQRTTPIGDAFIVPGATVAGATIDVARTVVRRAERQVARLLHDGEMSNGETLRYLNRLSDLLFVLARAEEHASGTVAPAARRDDA